MKELLLIEGVYAIEVPEDAELNEWKIFDVDGKSYLNGMTSDGEMSLRACGMFQTNGYCSTNTANPNAK